MPGRNHMPTVGQNKSLHQLGDTDSGASILIHPTLPSFGWHHAARNHELINTLQLHKVSCDGGEWKKRRGWGGRGLSSVHRAAASGINNTAHSSAKYLVFLPLLSASFLIPTQIPANNSVLFPCCHSPYSLHLFPTDISLPQSIKSREKVILTNSVSLYPFTWHILSNTVFKLISLHRSANHWNDPLFTCFLFFNNIYPLLSLFSLSASPMSLK